jgi:uncharacterized protein (DUF2235 family)
MGKHLVVCCDGTANEFVIDHTNVLKLFRVLDKDPEAESLLPDEPMAARPTAAQRGG